MTDFTEELISIQKNAENGNLEPAYQDCEKIVLEHPDNAEALHLSAYLSILRGRSEEAIPRLMQALSEQPENYVFHSTLAIAYQSEGKIGDAIASLQRALKCHPEDVESMVGLSSMLSEEGDLAQGLQLAQKALKLEPENSLAMEQNNLLSGHLHNKLISRFDGLVPDEIGTGKPKVIYALRPIFRIGHVIIEPFMLKCLYDPDEYDIIILTPPRDETVSIEVYDFALRDTFPVQVDLSHPVFVLWSGNNGTHEIEGRTYVLDHLGTLYGQVLAKLRDEKFPYLMTLSEEDHEKGKKLRQEMGVPDDAEIVTLFVREAGFLYHLPEHNIRNADIRNYIPAINYLVDEGYYVVRIGDNKMHPLPDLGPQVIDTPFHDAYTRFVEPYFVSQSTFMIKTISGPEVLSYAFGIPALVTNTYVVPCTAATKNDIYLFKRYFSHRYGRNLTLREIASDSTLLFTNLTSVFTERHIELIENQESELLAATKQMVARHRGEDDLAYPENERFQEICAQLHADCQNDIYRENYTSLNTDYFALHSIKACIPRCINEYYPEFLW